MSYEQVMARIYADTSGNHPTFAMRDQRLPPAPPPVRVAAVSPTFCVGGQRVEVGEIVSVPPDIADGLVHLGKARRA